LQIIFSDGFGQHCRSLGVSRETVTDLLENAEKTQSEKFDNLDIRFFVKKEAQAESYLLLMAQLKDKLLHPDVILRFRSDLFPNTAILEPIMILQLLAQEYGMVLRIGRRLGRFYYREDVPLDREQTTVNLVGIVDETGHDFLCSSYVSLSHTASGPVARCALAFCIDKCLYNNWLASSPLQRRPEDPRHRLITRIISVNRKNEIEASCKSEPNTKERFYKIELRLAIELITRIIGEPWYRKVYEGLPKVSGEDNPQLLRHYIRVTGLGHFLNQLWRRDDSNNLQHKIEELQGLSFENAYFELKIAAHFDRRGFDVKFVKRKKGLKTPDFQINSTDGYAFVECKRKDAQGLAIDGDIEKAASQIEEFGGPGVIFVELLETLDRNTVKNMVERARLLLTGKNRIAMCVFTNEELRDEVDTQAMATQVWPITVPGMSLPESIRKAALFQDPVDWFPLSGQR